MSTEVTIIEAEEIPIEKAVEKSFLTQLEKLEITKQFLVDKKDECLQLKLNGQDKEAYTLIRETRLNMKARRVAIEKVCKKGREDATRTQKAWLAQEKEWVMIVEEGETYLEGLEDEFEKEKERIAAEVKRNQEEAFIIRQAELTKMGATYQDGNFVLNDVSYEAILIKESDNDVWEIMKKKFYDQFLINEAGRLEVEKKKEEAAAELLRQQQEQERKQKELEEREAAIKKSEEAAAKAEQERVAKEKAEENQRVEKLWRGRLEQLRPIGWNSQEAFAKYDESVIVATYEQLTTWTDEEFAVVKEKHFLSVAADEKAKEEKRLAEIEEQKKLAAAEAVKKEQERVAEETRKAEDKRVQENAKKAEEALKATDKTKWASFLKSIESIQLPEMKHPSYKQKVVDAKKYIAKITDL